MVRTEVRKVSRNVSLGSMNVCTLVRTLVVDLQRYYKNPECVLANSANSWVIK